MFKKFIITFTVIVIGILLYATTKPDTFRIERSITIKAPAERIFPYINDFHQWTTWSPFDKIDSVLQRNYAGADSGVGAIYEWKGDKTGQGRMEITESTPASRVTIQLNFIKPMEFANTSEFTLLPKGDSTAVTWAMFGVNTYMGKVMSVMGSMERALGKEFEKGLTGLKTVVEQSTEKPKTL